MKHPDFSQKQRMGSEAFVVILAQQIKQWSKIFYAGIIWSLPNLHNPNKFFVIIGITIVVFVLLAILSACYRYRYTLFYIADHSLYIQRGLIAKRITVMPLDRIHNIRSKNGIFYRLFDMEGLEFDTAGSAGAEAEIILPHAQADAFRHAIAMQELSVTSLPVCEECDADVALQDFPEPTELSQEEPCLHTTHFSIGQLLMGAYTQNHIKGFLLFLVFIFTIYNQVEDLVKDMLLHILKDSDSMVQNVVNMSLGAQLMLILQVSIVVYIMSIVIWGTAIVFRQAGLTLRLYPSRMEYTAGLITEIRQRIRRSKVIILSWKQNILERKSGLYTVIFDQAHNIAGNEKQRKASITIFGLKDPGLIIDWWAHDPDILTAPVIRSGGGLMYYNWFVKCLLPSLPITLVFALFLPLMLSLTAVWLVIGTVGAYLTYRHAGVAVSSRHLLVYTGRYASIKRLIPISRIERVEVRQALWQLPTGRCSLWISTMGDDFVLRSLPYAEVNRLRNYLLFVAES
ncbi:PH domain-containing protein [Porphyromonas pogonae]|uniref:PH domain-containing protein n=1 Tax=Porphyromonas pogonae TaxID=867595 RepID=UPI002E79772C|nr:PH domain-containing protein [Porphyromonas pogonae]